MTGYWDLKWVVMIIFLSLFFQWNYVTEFQIYCMIINSQYSVAQLYLAAISLIRPERSIYDKNGDKIEMTSKEYDIVLYFLTHSFSSYFPGSVAEPKYGEEIITAIIE